MIIGITGTGKSTLVNNLLFNGEKKAPEVACKIGNQEPTTPYQNKKDVPNLKLIDTRGIELTKAWSVNNIGDAMRDFIQEQLAKKDINDFVHCIWYCVGTNRFQDEEKILVDNVISSIRSIKIPVIIVLTQAVNDEVVEEMKNYIKKYYNDVIRILAKRIKHGNSFIEPFGLKELVHLTIKKCREGFNGNMKTVMMKNVTNYIKMNLFANNSKIKSRIIRAMMSDTIENDLANKDFDGYINDIYYYNVCYFLNQNTMGNNSNSLIKKSEFNRHKTNFFAFCHNYENQIISKEIIQKFAYQFLEIQAAKEIEKNQPVLMINKRNYNAFVNTTLKYLTDNFGYFAKKYYIYYVITNLSLQLSSNFEQELNMIVESLMVNNDIQDMVAECFNKKFLEFEQNAKRYPPFLRGNNNYDLSYSEPDDGFWMNNISDITKYKIDNTPIDKDEIKFL